MKNTGVLRNTQSRFPSSVLIFMANPCKQISGPLLVGCGRESLMGDARTRISRTVSADPDSGATVENRTVKGTCVPSTVWNTSAEVISESESVNSKYP